MFIYIPFIHIFTGEVTWKKIHIIVIKLIWKSSLSKIVLNTQNNSECISTLVFFTIQRNISFTGRLFKVHFYSKTLSILVETVLLI